MNKGEFNMSFFSRSSKRNHYKHGGYGSGHYQRKGILGNLFDIIASRSHSGAYYRSDYRNGQGSQYGNGQPHSNPASVGCSGCGSQIPAGSKFCLNCGKAVSAEQFCPNCGGKAPSGARFCQDCGNKLNG
jgi:predicted nucleic acid-binding Zn ribbon protein